MDGCRLTFLCSEHGWPGRQERGGHTEPFAFTAIPYEMRGLQEPSVQVRAAERTGCPKQPINSRVKTKCLLLSLMKPI